jgi:hypothetical protein
MGVALLEDGSTKGFDNESARCGSDAGGALKADNPVKSWTHELVKQRELHMPELAVRISLLRTSAKHLFKKHRPRSQASGRM